MMFGVLDDLMTSLRLRMALQCARRSSEWRRSETAPAWRRRGGRHRGTLAQQQRFRGHRKHRAVQSH